MRGQISARPVTVRPFSAARTPAEGAERAVSSRASARPNAKRWGGPDAAHRSHTSQHGAPEQDAGQPGDEAPLDTGPLALVYALKILGLPADAEQIRHSLGVTRTMSETDLLRAARRIPVKV